MPKEFVCHTLDELHEICAELMDFAGNTKIWLIEGEMGSGKTTLIKALSHVLGSSTNFSSPSFSIVNEYSYSGGKIFHFDLYRIKNTNELYDLGIEDYLDSNNYCFVEWPNALQELLEDNFMRVHLSVNKNIRYIRASKSHA